MRDYREYISTYNNMQVTQSYWPSIKFGKLYDCSIGHELRTAAMEVPDRIALVEGHADGGKRRRWTYSELLAESERVASALLCRFQPGEHVALWSRNSAEWILMYYGCALAGLVVVTVNPAYKEQEFEYVMRQSDAVGLIMADEHRGFDMLAALQKIKPALPVLREVIRLANYEEFVSTGDPSIPFPNVDAQDPFIIMYTSGTTGVPKGALLYHSGLLNTNYYVGMFSQLGPNETWIAPLPLFHISTCGLAVLGCMTHRAKLVIMPVPDVVDILDCFEKEGGTYIQLPPVLLNSILSHPARTQSHLKTLKTIGGMEFKPATVDLIYRELGTHIKYWICYGQTESHGVITETHPDDADNQILNTAGRPFPWCELKIADRETGEILPLGEVGEVCFRGYQNMLGYYNMPEATAQTLESDGWQHSGDLGTMDERGFVKITGRLKDMIRRGGENIYPREVEGILLLHPKVQNAIVLGVPNEEWGEEVAAVITPHSAEESPTPKELFDFCRTKLSHFKVPRIWLVTLKDMPYTGAGKAQKFVIRDSILSGELVTERI